MKLTTSLLLFSVAQAAALFPDETGINTGDWFLCPRDRPVTCSINPTENDCCYENPGGVIVQAQSWGYNPAVGSSDNFTLKGIKPAKCDGTFQEFCNSLLTVNENDLNEILLNQFGAHRLYNEMDMYWKTPAASGVLLWAEEFNKHGSCFSTLRPVCYSENYQENENIYDYFRINIDMYHKYPTYQALSSAGIVPSTLKTYTLEEITSALSSINNGHSVYLGCDENNALVEVGYYAHFAGPLIIKSYQPIDSLAQTTCPTSGIKFLPKI